MVCPSASRGSITRPAEVRHRYRRDEPGAQVEVVERDERVIELHSLLAHRADQAWLWANRWQEMESAADLEREAAERGLA